MRETYTIDESEESETKESKKTKESSINTDIDFSDITKHDLKDEITLTEHYDPNVLKLALKNPKLFFGDVKTNY